MLSQFRRRLLVLAGPLSILLWSGWEVAASVTDFQPPNILIITLDHLGHNDLQLYNSQSPIFTPHLDQLAREGVQLTNFYTIGSTATETRASLLTGRIPRRHSTPSTWAALSDRARPGLRSGEILISQALKQSSTPYATALIGTSQIGLSSGSNPLDFGFDEIVEINFDEQGRMEDLDNPNSAFDLPVLNGDRFAMKTIDFIESNTRENKPWFIYLPIDAMNSDPEIPAEYTSNEHASAFPGEKGQKEKEVDQQAVLSILDDAMGLIFDALDSLGIAENTFVLFTAENGSDSESPASFKGKPGTSRDQDNKLNENRIKVPSLAMWKGKIPPGQIVQTPLWTPDIFHACTHLAGVSVPGDRIYDGKNPLPVLTGETNTSPHNAFYFEQGSKSALVSGDWKIVRRSTTDPWQLYYIREDKLERENLAEQKPELVKKLGDVYLQKKTEVNSYRVILESDEECDCK